MRRLGLLLAFLALFAMAGGHWAVVQSVAWGEMLVTYSQQAGLRQGLAQTFDGDHPCPLCLQVAQKKQHEATTPAAALADAKKKTDSLPLGAALALPSQTGARLARPALAAQDGPARSDRPPVPPPPSLSA